MNKTLFLENVKRNWLIAFAGFLLYFLSGPFVMIVSGNQRAVYEVVMEFNIGFWFLELALPAACTLTIFSYLNRAASCSVLHSMPFSRTTLYVTNYLSGLALCEVPMLLNGAIMAVLSKTVRASRTDVINSYTVGEVSVGSWILISAITLFFVYSICVLGAMVSGNGIISFLTGMFFNFLVPAFAFSLIGFGSVYLRGFYLDSELENILFRLHPSLSFFRVISGISEGTADYGLFVLAGAVVTAGGYLLYKIRPLENAGDSYVFPPVKYGIGFLLTYFTSSLVGLICTAEFGTGKGIIGFALGALTGFVISRMIVMKTTRIFNLRTLRAFAIIVLVIAVIIAAFTFDIFGYETFVPNPDDVVKAELEAWDMNRFYSGNSTITFENPESIRNVTELHRYLTGVPERDDYEGEGNWRTVSIGYQYSDGRRVRREFTIDTKYMDSPEFRNVYASSEAKKDVETILEIDAKDADIYVIKYGDSPAEYYNEEDRYLSTAEKKELLNDIYLDMKDRSFDDMIRMVNDRVGDNQYGIEITLHGVYDTEKVESWKTSLPGYGWYDQDGERCTVYINYSMYDYDARTNIFVLSHPQVIH